MKLLAIETSTEACSVALWNGTDMFERHELAPRRHAELVLQWCDRLLAEAGLVRTELDALAVGRGPGGFTGVRLGVAVVQGIAFALDKPVYPISTLAALSMQVEAAADIPRLAAIDARMGEVYLGLYRRDAGLGVVALGPEWMGPPQTVDCPGTESLYGIGSGYAAAQGALATRLGQRLLGSDAARYPRAADVARLALAEASRHAGIRWDQLQPAYLRDKVALTLDERARAMADPQPNLG